MQIVSINIAYISKFHKVISSFSNIYQLAMREITRIDIVLLLKKEKLISNEQHSAFLSSLANKIKELPQYQNRHIEKIKTMGSTKEISSIQSKYTRIFKSLNKYF